MKFNRATGTVSVPCVKCGNHFSLKATTYLTAPLEVKTKCPKCRGVKPIHKGGKKR